MSVERLLGRVQPAVARTLDGVLAGDPLSVPAAVALCEVTGVELHALCFTADELRRRQVGPRVGYVVNRNVNFTNLCTKSCKFCAFSRTGRSEEGYFLDEDEVVRRALQAQSLGATEICIQAGLPPNAKPTLYLDLLRAIKSAAPALHVHAYSPEEVKYGAALLRLPTAEYLVALRDAGIGSLPGTSAEILDDGVRKRLAGGRISTAEWVEVITTAHKLGIRTTATIMYGHIETHEQRMRHLDLLRSIQRETSGFTEIVPLSFVHAEAPLHMKRMLPDAKPGPTAIEVTRLLALSRLMLGDSVRNVQTSWVKEGVRQAQWLLDCGANDLGGTLMNESISTSAGAQHGQLMRPAELRRLIREAGRLPVERNTLYGVVRELGPDAASDPAHPLDAVTDAEATFGSYTEFTRKARSRAQAKVDPV